MIGTTPIKRALRRLAWRGDQPATASMPTNLLYELVEMTGGDPDLSIAAERVREERRARDSRAKYGYLLFLSTFK
jgi:hypothetical protein